MFKLIRILFLLLVFLCIGLYLFLTFVDLNRFKKPIEKEISALLDKDVQIDTIGVKMSLSPALSVKGLVIGTSNEFSKPLAKVDSLDLTFSIMPMFKGVFELNGIEINGANVSLIDKDGKQNWVSTDKKTVVESLNKQTKDEILQSKPNKALSRLLINQIVVNSSTISYHKGDLTESIVIDKFSVLNMKDISASFIYRDIPMQITYTGENILTSIDSGKLTDFTFNLRAFNGISKISGVINDLHRFDDIHLMVEVSLPNLNQAIKQLTKNQQDLSFLNHKADLSFALKGLNSTFNIEKFKFNVENTLKLNLETTVNDLYSNPQYAFLGNLELNSNEVTKKYSIKPINANFDILMKQNEIDLNKISLFINRSDVFLNGKVNLSGKVPYLNGKITSNYFNVADVYYKEDTIDKTTKSVSSTSTSTKEEKIDLSALKLLNGKLDVVFNNVKILDSDKEHHKGSFFLQLQDGILDVSKFNFNLFAGQVNGNLFVDSKNTPIEYKANVLGNSLNISEIKAVSEQLTNAVSNFSINVNAKGDTKSQIVSSLNGEVRGEILSGVIVNKWFNSLPKLIGLVSKNSAFSYADTNQTSELTCAAMDLKVKDGIIYSEKNIALETPMANLIVNGEINLPKETLSLSLIPSLNQLTNKVNKKLSFAQYVRLEGPFSNIRMKEDVKGALNDAKEKQIEKLLEKLTGEKSTQKESTMQVGGLCQIALGKKIETIVVKKQPIQPVKQDEQKVQPQKDLKETLENQVKEQLAKSLTEVLKKK